MLSWEFRGELKLPLPVPSTACRLFSSPSLGGTARKLKNPNQGSGSRLTFFFLLSFSVEGFTKRNLRGIVAVLSSRTLVRLGESQNNGTGHAYICRLAIVVVVAKLEVHCTIIQMFTSRRTASIVFATIRSPSPPHPLIASENPPKIADFWPERRNFLNGVEVWKG